MHDAYSALILAGGKSSRMGMDKRNLMYKGSTLLNCTLNLLKQLTPSNIFISGNDIEGGIQDIVQDIGPIAGIHAASKRTKESLLVLPIDMPMLQPSDCLQLIKIAQEHARCTTFKGSPLPCFLHHASSYHEVIEEIINTYSSARDLSLYTMTQKLNAILIDSEQVDLSNINKPQDYEKLRNI